MITVTEAQVQVLLTGLATLAAVVSALCAAYSVARGKRADKSQRNDAIRLALSIEQDRNGSFVLVNQGHQRVRKVRFVNPPRELTQLPQEFDLPARGKSEQFRLIGGMQTEQPDYVHVQWLDLDEPVPIDFPRDPEGGIAL